MPQQKLGDTQIAQFRYIKILTWLRGLRQQNKRNCIEDDRWIINFFRFIPLSLGAKLEFWALENCACCKNIWRITNTYIGRHLGRKYARIFVLGHYLFLKAYSFHPATLSNKCYLLGTDNVRRHISELVFAPHWRPLSVYFAFQLTSVENTENQSNHSSQSRNKKKTRWTNQTPSTYT